LASAVFHYPWGYSRYDYGIGAPYYQGGFYYGPPESYAPLPTTPPPADQLPLTDPSHESSDPHVANVEIRLPANATLWVEGQQMTTTGAVRHFYTPKLTEGENYTYEIHARWTDASGKTVERTKNLDVKAGSWLGLDFNRADQPNQTPNIRMPMKPVDQPTPTLPAKDGPPRRPMPPVEPPTFQYDWNPTNPVPMPTSTAASKVAYQAYGDLKKTRADDTIRTARGN
jgi:uncharacterized protein (TIGR03000 family)